MLTCPKPPEPSSPPVYHIEVACNNLGGQGPGDSDEPAELRFRRAGFVGDRPVDVVPWIGDAGLLEVSWA